MNDKEKTQTPDEWNVNDQLQKLRLDLANVVETVKRFNNLGMMIGRIGGLMPCNVRAALKGVPGMEDPDLTDSGFTEAVVKVRRNNTDPIKRALAFACLTKKLAVGVSGIEQRIEKLAERIRNQKSGPEYETAVRLKRSAKGAKKVLEARVAIVLKEFFAARKQVVEGIVRITEAVYTLFPDGSPIVREAALSASCASLMASFADMDRKLNTGLHTTVRKSVKI